MFPILAAGTFKAMLLFPQLHLPTIPHIIVLGFRFLSPFYCQNRHLVVTDDAAPGVQAWSLHTTRKTYHLNRCGFRQVRRDNEKGLVESMRVGNMTGAGLTRDGGSSGLHWSESVTGNARSNHDIRSLYGVGNPPLSG
jgi:hypothetical protein